MDCGYGGWRVVGNQVPAGRLLVCDASSVYGFGRNRYDTHGSHVGLGKTHYRLFGCAKEPKVSEPSTNKHKKRSPARTRVEYNWSEPISLIARAMVLADRILFVAGPPSVIDPDGKAPNREGAIENQKGSLLWAFSAEDGARLAEYNLDSACVFDGMIAANGRLYISTQDGRLLCMGAKK
jgi:outer membrane protein assembly factor BamB